MYSGTDFLTVYNVHTVPVCLFIKIQTYEHHRINRIINGVIIYADQMNNCFLE